MFARLAFALTLLASGISLLAQPQTQSPPTAQQNKPPEPCTVSGRVVSAAEGTPIQSARVGLIQEDVKQHPAVYGVTTDDQGHFEIKTVPAGRYRFIASRPGFISQEYKSQANKGGAVLALSPGQTVDDAMFRLTRAAAVNGRVLDDNGVPMLGIYVSALRKPTLEEMEESSHKPKREHLVQSSSAVTDDRGEYRIFGLKPGEYYLKATESPDEASMFVRGADVDFTEYALTHEMASQYAPLYYPGVLQPTEAEPLQLRAGEDAQADFSMRHIKTVKVSGHVLGADGKPATHAWVSMQIPDIIDFSEALSVTTDEKGEFIIKGVSPGSYILAAQQHSEHGHNNAHQKLDVGEADLDNVALSFGSGVSISGRMTATGSGVALDRAHVYLSALDEDTGPGGWADVKADGTFELNNVADGSYILRAGLQQKGWYVQSARLGATDVLQKGIQIERGTPPGSLEIVMSSAGAQLEGAVTQDNQPVVGASIRLRPEPESPYNEMRGTAASTDQNGHFTIPTVPPGKYRVVAKLPSGSPEVLALASEPQTITLGEHDHQTLQLTIPKPEQ